jgi:GAF domain-containing protein
MTSNNEASFDSAQAPSRTRHDHPAQQRWQGRDARAPVVETAAVLQDLVLDSADVKEFLTGLATLAATRLSGPEDPGHGIACGVTLLRSRKRGTVASSSPTARSMDELQYGFGDGPCLRAARTETTVYVEDVLSDNRWTDYFQAVAAHGVRSILAVPILLDGEAAAALNFYAPAADAFGAGSIDAAQKFAWEASQGLRLAVRVAHLTDAGQNLTTAMQSRTTIDLAVGIIMGQNRSSQEQAMMILKAASSARNMKLRDVAAAVVRSVNAKEPTTHFDQ